MSKMKFVTSKEAGMHARLNQMAGAWEGMTRTWFEKDVLADESPMSGIIKPVLDGRFLLHEYTGSLNNKPFAGIALYGYDLNSSTFQSAWVDSFHTGTTIMLSTGNKDAAEFKVTGSYSDGAENGQQWGWRTELTLLDENTLTITAWNITPEGEEAMATETLYKRKAQ